MMGQMDLTTLAGIAFAVVGIGVIAFQVALALGAPWGAYAMGGAFPGRLPSAMRVAAVAQAVVIGLLVVAVLAAAGIGVSGLAASLPWLVWVAVVVSAIAVVLNAISRSTGERRIWLPVSLVMLISSLVVALTA